MGRKSDPPVVLIKWYDFTKCACVDCSRQTRAKCESTSSGVEPLTGGRGIGIVGSSGITAIMLLQLINRSPGCFRT